MHLSENRVKINEVIIIESKQEMIDDKLLRMLKNPNPDQRKKAITELAKTKNREALTHLANVYRSDSDPEIRELARKAGVYISKNTPQGGAAKPKNNSAAYAYDTDEDEYGDEEAYDYGAAYADEDDGDSYGSYGSSYGSSSLYGDEDEDDDGGYGSLSYGDDGEIDSYDDADDVEEEVVVSALDQERAQGLVQQALDVHMRGNNDRAIKYLAQAYTKNPRLKRDSYTSGLAATITGLPSDQAVDYIIEMHGGGGGKTKRGQKSKRGGAAADDPTWGDALVDLAIYWFVNLGLYAVGAILIYVLLANVTQAALTAPSASSSFNTPGMPTTQQIMDLFNATAIPLMLLYCVAVATFSLIGLIIHYYAIHFVSIGMLGGDGTMPRLIRKLTLFYTFTVPLLTFVVGFASGFLQATSPDMAGIAALVQFGLSLGVSFWTSAKIGDAYEFGAGRGCAALVLSYIAIGICGCMLIWVLTSMLGSAFSQAVILF